MLKAYKPIKNSIFDAHKLIEYLVIEVWCKSDNQRCRTKLNDELKILYDNTRLIWFKKSLNEIYKVSKTLSIAEKDAFQNAFEINNNIEALCSNPTTRVTINTLNKDLLKVILPFFKELYSNFLKWVDVSAKYGSKKEYYNDLITFNKFKFCPCCGFGQIKTIYDDGHSPFDHYLPLKHYPFSVVNFNNLIPLCNICNSDNKGEKDILKKDKKVFFPLNKKHKEIGIKVEVETKIFKRIIVKINKSDELDKNDVAVDFSDKSEEITSWDEIFKIKKRYFGQIANNRENWLNDVKQVFRNKKIKTANYVEAFDMVIELDSNKELGFLKTPFLNKMKSFTSLIEAYEEVTGDYIIK